MDPGLCDEVLARLGVPAAPRVSPDGLGELYRAWCMAVPFDNLRKRCSLADPAPLPGLQPDDFFSAWLDHGAGGTCWPTAAALHALLTELGFDARLAAGAMRDDLVGEVPSHGSVVVHLDSGRYWVDPSMLSEQPLPLQGGKETAIDTGLHRLRAEPVGERWRIHWENAVTADPIGCLVLDTDVTPQFFADRYEASRGFSPFNTHLYVSTDRPGARVGFALGSQFRRDATGVETAALDGDARTRYLIDALGYSEELVGRLPPDG